jgi:uncharacterized protein
MENNIVPKHIYCPNCKAVNYDYYNFCYNCSFSLKEISKELKPEGPVISEDKVQTKDIKCTNCGEIIEVNEEEINLGKFTCPLCNTENTIDDKTIITPVISDGAECGNCKENVILLNKELEERKFTCPNCNTENRILPEKLTEEEKMMSLLAHLSIVLGSFIIPLIIWIIQKKKSQFVRFHSLQSVFFHLGGIGIFIFTIILILIGFHGSDSSSTGSTLPGLSIFLLMWITIPFIGLIFSVYASVKSYQGIRYKMPFVGEYVYKLVYKINRPY